MRMRPTVLIALAALMLPAPAMAAGGNNSSISRLRSLQAARTRALAAQTAAERQAAADVAQRVKQAEQAAAAKKRAEKKAQQKPKVIPGVGPVLERAAIAEVDDAYQAAVKTNDFNKMDKILGDHLFVVLGNGQTVTRTDLLNEAQSNTVYYTQQDEVPGTRQVRVNGNLGVVTALLWVKGEGINGKFDNYLWFSSTYVRTADGWRYAFGQMSLPLPPEAVYAMKNKLVLAQNAAAAADRIAAAQEAAAAAADQQTSGSQTLGDQTTLGSQSSDQSTSTDQSATSQSTDQPQSVYGNETGTPSPQY